MIRRVLFSLVLLVMTQPVGASTLRVPKDHKSIQAAIDASAPGDIILVAPGRYSERIGLKPEIILRSDGDDIQGSEGLKRAERTILDGGGEAGKAPGVVMAEGTTLDGFTITNVGLYDDDAWKQHFDSQGEQLGDDEGSVQAEGMTPAVSIQGVNCTVMNCLIHHNGDVGIGILGKEGVTSNPLITRNIVYRNMGGGIGVAEGAEPIIRGNRCSENLRAGIGCRRANPIITDNLCFQNVRAGIGCREGSKPIIRGNQCFQNRRAGIGIRMEGTAPIVVGNECFENEMAGIGVQGQATAVIHGNKCHDNKLVAIGVTGGSTATITKNELSRRGGVPPIIALKDDSTATIQDNRISGGGVAAVLVQGQAIVTGNMFIGIGEKQGNAVWIREGSSATVSQNSFDGYRAAVNATKAKVFITANRISQFQGSAIIVKDSPEPVHVFGNTGISTDPQAKVVDVHGASGIIESNLLSNE